MKSYEKYKSVIEECDIHASRLEKASLHLLPLFPMTEEQLANLPDLDLGFLEILITRFSKLQDTMGAKLFPQLVEMLQQKDIDKMTFIDILNRLEKSELLPSASDWRAMRDFRNHLTHEYPNNPELMVKNLNASLGFVKDLLEYWKGLRPRAIEIKDQFQREF